MKSNQMNKAIIHYSQKIDLRKSHEKSTLGGIAIQVESDMNRLRQQNRAQHDDLQNSIGMLRQQAIRMKSENSNFSQYRVTGNASAEKQTSPFRYGSKASYQNVAKSMFNNKKLDSHYQLSQLNSNPNLLINYRNQSNERFNYVMKPSHSDLRQSANINLKNHKSTYQIKGIN